MRVPFTSLIIVAVFISMLSSFSMLPYGSTTHDVAPYGDDMLVRSFDTKDEFDDLERELEEEAWHFAEEAHVTDKIQCWASCVWKKFMNLFGADNVVPEECSWGACPGSAPTE